ncbi:MAG: methylmalonyl-CoA epimerase [Caldithrix sp.]|nr:methylmalonyl-CoA epimerase [Caldithrix sp.]
MITQINHIGIAVQALDDHIPFYRDVLGLEFSGTEEVEDQKVRVAMFKAGEVQIELLEPTSEDSPIAKYLQKKGEGMHHIAYETNDIQGDIDNFREQQIRMIDELPREGAHNTKIAFIHPKSSGKVLTEICQKGEAANE